MADLFLHLPFARRLRLAEGLHPLIGETLARRQALVALGASLPRLPGVERKGMSFFRRLFSGGSDAARWQKVFAGTPSPQARLVCNYLQPTNDTGPMARLAIALGALSHELVEAKLAPVMSSVSPGDRPGVERAQARLWLQAVIPNSRDLGAEWRGLTEFTDLDQSRRIFDHVDAALGATYSQRPGRDVLVRWGKGLVSEVGPLEEAGLPPSLNVTDHAARGPHFDDNGFVPALQAAMEWFVILANRLGEACTDGELTDEQVTTALCAGDAALVENDEEAAARPERWTTWIQATRARMLDRGKNEEPAFIEGVGEVKPVHRSNAFTGMMNLADLPQDQLPPELNNPSLPPESAAASPPVPHTQEISLANLEAMGSDAARPPLPLDASGPLPVAPRPPVPPALTQEISVAQIEEAHASFPTPAHTQEISALQIEGEAAAAVPPAAPVPTPAAPPPEAPAVAAPAAPAPPAPPPPVSVDGMVATTPTPPADATAAPTAPVPPVAADGLVASTPSAPSAPVSADGIVATTPPATGDDADPPRE